MAKNHYTIDYWLDEKDGELHLTIYQDTKIVHTEDILGDFEDKEDIKLTCLEVASSRGLSPVLFKDEPMQYSAR